MTQSYTWLEVFRKDYGATTGQSRLLSSAEFTGFQYIGIGRPNAGGTAEVYRRNLQDKNKWEDCTPKWPKTGIHSQPGGNGMVLVAVGGQLYLGNDKGCVYFSDDGKSWDVAYSHDSGGIIDAIVEFGGNIYIATAGDIIKGTIYKNGTIFSKVVGKGTNYPAAFGKHDLRSLEVFNNFLYAGIGKDNDNGIQLWRTAKGTAWALFHDVTPPPLYADTVFPGHVHAMKVFKNHLYIGTYHGNYLYRTDGSKAPSPTHWELIDSGIASSGDILRLEEKQGHLYMGLSFLTKVPADKECLLYTTSDGKKWEKLAGSPSYEPRNAAISLLKTINGKLYVGDFGPAFKPAVNDALRMWEVEGPTQGPVFLGQIPDQYEQNDSLQSATDLSIDANTKNSQYINDASLSKEDIDVWKLKFSTDEDYCTGNKTIKLFDDVCWAEIGNSFLIIKIYEENCIPFEINIIKADGSNYDYNKFYSGSDIYIECPTYLFGDYIFLQIKNKKDKPVNNYNLQLNVSNGYFMGRCRAPLYKFWETQLPPWQDLIDPRDRFFDVEDLIKDFEDRFASYIESLDRYLLGELNLGLGRLAMEAGEYKIAEDRLIKSVELFESQKFVNRRGEAARELGAMHSKLRRSEEAEAFFGQAMDLHRSGSDALGLALDEVQLARHKLDHSPEETLVLAINAYSVLQDLPASRAETIDALMLQSQAFLEMKESEPAVAALVIGEQCLKENEDGGLVHQLNQQAARLMDVLGVREYLGMRENIGDKATILLELRASRIPTEIKAIA